MDALFTIIFTIITLFSVASCGSDKITIAVPNDTTNEARALLLLENQGIIKLKEGAGITATVRDIVENPHNIKIEEIEAAQLPRILDSVSFAVINSNYAISGGLNPIEDALAFEDSSSAYSNILACKSGNENTPKIQALKVALESRAVKDFITSTYNGAVISVVANPDEDGYSDSIDYASLKGTKITVAASATPHAEILEIAKNILAAKEITLEIKVYDDYVQPNLVVDSGDLDANYFQHTPYLDDFNTENKTNVVSVSAIHVEPLGIYGGKLSSLDIFK